jgi:hypothetical protein
MSILAQFTKESGRVDERNGAIIAESLLVKRKSQALLK